MKKILGYDPDTGMTEIFHHDSETDVSMIETRQDVTQALKYTQELAKDQTYTRVGMKEEWLHYGYLPDSIILKFHVEHGLSITNPDHAKAIFRLVNEQYPKFKTTEMRHNPKG